MAKTQDLKRRIKSIRNTMQLTKAMKMVAAAKLRRAQERMMSARPYADRTRRVLQALASKADAETHPLLAPRGDQRIETVLVTADRGLCGGFNAGAIRAAVQLFAENPGRDISINAIGKKGRVALREHEIVAEWADVFRHVEYSKAQEIAAGLMKRYMDGKVDKVFLVYNEFKSAIQAIPRVKQLLPIVTDSFESDDEDALTGDYIYEPSAKALFAALLPHYIENQVFQAMIESAAAEHGARMTAMDAATKNAGELIDNLTLTMNRVRQASITTEIIEVVSGAEALG